MLLGFSTCASLGNTPGPGAIAGPGIFFILFGLPILGVVTLVVCVFMPSSDLDVRFSDDAKSAIKAAKAIKWRLDNPYTTSLHILAGAATLNSSRYPNLLASHSITLDKIKAELSLSPPGNQVGFENGLVAPSYSKIIEGAQKTSGLGDIPLESLLVEVLSETTGPTVDFLRKYSINAGPLVSEITTVGV